MRSFVWLALPLVLLCGPAQASEKEADTCLRTKIWDGYGEGWAVRTATSATLSKGDNRVYLVTLYAGNEYQIMVCADSNAQDVDLILHDAEGIELVRDSTEDREPVVVFKPANTETYYLVMHAGQVQDGQQTGVAMAVTYR